MDLSDYLELVGVGLIGVGIPLIFWTVSIILIYRKSRHNRGKAERLLITGIWIKIIINILNIAINHLSTWLLSTGMDVETALTISRWVQYISQFTGYIGIIIILWAFWVKFFTVKERKAVITERN